MSSRRKEMENNEERNKVGRRGRNRGRLKRGI